VLFRSASASLSIVNDTVGAMVDSGVIQAGAVPVEILGSAAQVVSLVGTVLSLGTDSLDLMDAGNKFSKSRKSVDPVERLLAEEMLADAITALTRDAVKAGLDVASLIVRVTGNVIDKGTPGNLLAGVKVLLHKKDGKWLVKDAEGEQVRPGQGK